MTGQEDLTRVFNLISWWITIIESHNAVGFFDINKISEGLALKLLNEIYGYRMENLNYETSNYPGIDLGDRINKIGFQISSRMDSKKFIDSIEKFSRGPKKIYSNGIRFLILQLKKKPHLNKSRYITIYPDFDPDRHILTAKDLLKEIRHIYDSEKDRFYRIKKILEKEITGKTDIKEELGSIKLENGKGNSLKNINGKISKFNPKFLLIMAIFGTLSEIAFISSIWGASVDFIMKISDWLLLMISFAIEYIVYAICLQNICDRLRMPDGFISWLPVFNILLMMRIAKVKMKITLKKLLSIITIASLLFIPIIIAFLPLITVVFFMILWSRIAPKLCRSREYGLLAGIPIIGKFVVIEIAFRQHKALPLSPLL